MVLQLRVSSWSCVHWSAVLFASLRQDPNFDRLDALIEEAETLAEQVEYQPIEYEPIK